MSRSSFVVFCSALILAFCSTSAQAPSSPTVVMDDMPPLHLLAATSDDTVLKATGPSAVTLYGTAERIVSTKHESGTVILKISTDGANSEEWIFPSGQSQYAEGGLASNRECLRTDSQQIVTSESGASCQRPLPWFAAWFAPTLSKASLLNSEVVDSNDGAQIPDHVYSAIVVSTRSKSAHGLDELKRASSMRVTYDTGGLPLRSSYAVPAGAYGSMIHMTVVYGDYRDEGGFMLPHHIVRYVQGTIDLDVQLSRIAVN